MLRCLSQLLLRKRVAASEMLTCIYRVEPQTDMRSKSWRVKVQ